MTRTQMFTADDVFLGSVERTLTRVHAEMQEPYSHAWFCPSCGDVWARAHINNHKFTIEGGYCRKHADPSPFNVPGTMMIVWNEEFNSLLLSCPDAVKREFELHLVYAERNLV